MRNVSVFCLPRFPSGLFVCVADGQEEESCL